MPLGGRNPRSSAGHQAKKALTAGAVRGFLGKQKILLRQQNLQRRNVAMQLRTGAVQGKLPPRFFENSPALDESDVNK